MPRERLLPRFPRDEPTRGRCEGRGRCRAETSPRFGIVPVSVTAPSPSPAVRRSLHCSKIYFLFQLRYFLSASRAAALCALTECPCAPKKPFITGTAGSNSADRAGWRGSRLHSTPPGWGLAPAPACWDNVDFPCWVSRADKKSLHRPVRARPGAQHIPDLL